VRWSLTGGNVADIVQAQPLLHGLHAQYVLGDKGYDADSLVQCLRAQGTEPVIPPRSNRNEQREYDRHWYKDRNLIERFFNRIKHFRRIATRYEKLARNYSSFLALVSTLVWIR
jgi:transposase